MHYIEEEYKLVEEAIKEVQPAKKIDYNKINSQKSLQISFDRDF